MFPTVSEHAAGCSYQHISVATFPTVSEHKIFKIKKKQDGGN